MSRPDPSIAFLRGNGYSIFRVPRTSGEPLELLHRDGKDLTRLGYVPDLVDRGTIALPEVRRDDRPGIDIEGKQTSVVNAAIGLNILAAFVGAMGGGNLGVRAGFKNARTVTFSYTGVMEDRVDVLALEKYVKAGSISPHVPAGTLEKLLDDEVYVVTSILKTKQVVVEAQSDAGATVDIDMPAIQQAVGGSVKLERASASSSRVAFEGQTPVAFAFQAVQLVFDESGEFLTTMQLVAGDAAARGLERAAGRGADRVPVFLTAQGAFVRVAP
jgi:hypothetical protein